MNVVFILASYHHAKGLSHSAKARVVEAVSILKREPDSVVLTSGGIIKNSNTVSHSQLICKELFRLGISPARIIGQLTKARNTVEEAVHAKSFLAETSFDELKVVTEFAHYPRAPFIFAHFFPMDKLRFHLVPADQAKDVMLYAYWNEAESYRELRNQGGIYVGEEFLATPFTEKDYQNFLRTRMVIAAADISDHDYDARSYRYDMFSLRANPVWPPKGDN